MTKVTKPTSSLKQFVNVIPVSQNENNPLRCGVFQESAVETWLGPKEASGTFPWLRGPVSRCCGTGIRAQGGARTESGGGAPGGDRRKREVEGGEEVPPPPRSPLREVMWGQTENTRQGPKKGQ